MRDTGRLRAADGGCLEEIVKVQTAPLVAFVGSLFAAATARTHGFALGPGLPGHRL
jgi:hypothetical protein